MFALSSIAVALLSPSLTAAYLIDLQPAPFLSADPNPHYYFPINPTGYACTSIRVPAATQIAAIRVRSGPETGSPPQAIAFFNGDGCNDDSIELIIRFYQVAGDVEQAVAPELTYSSLADGLESYIPGQEMQAQNVYNHVQNVGYSSAVWADIINLGLEPGDAAFRYRSLDPDVVDTEWRVVKGVVILSDGPLPLEDVEHPDYSPLLNTDLLDLPTEERLAKQAEYQARAESFPAAEGVFLGPQDLQIGNPVTELAKEIESEYNRKIKIGKIARKASGMGPAGIRKYNPNAVELNPLAPYEGQSILEDLEAQRRRTVDEILEDPDWDLYWPTPQGPRYGQ
ncbi:hypothetical protein Dda_2237 [Drechslerella dactyloides]|uniref:Uncharacterized protein n=1 Tax=Drechslerella dactyloides TaxID=74499 RepID=A0AAD6J353_DREDA|nr:hypothetical protein Dda_2237 [Drechslerella dactyloides]